MFSTIFRLFMSVWMLALVLEFNLSAIPLVMVLTTIIVFVQWIRRNHFNRNFNGV